MQESGAVDRVKLNFENNKGTERQSSCMVEGFKKKFKRLFRS